MGFINGRTIPVKRESWKDVDNLVDTLLEHLRTSDKILTKIFQSDEEEEKEKLKDELINKARIHLLTQDVENEKAEEVIKKLNGYLFGYYILDSLIDDPDISDIKIYGPNRIRIKKLGERMNADKEIKFTDRKDYVRFVKSVAIKNKVNLSDINAVKTFTDSISNSKFILRFTVVIELLTSSSLPILHVRKIPKTKYTSEELIQKGELSQEEAEYLKQKIKNESGMLIVGKGGAGKTVLLNTLIEELPHNRSGMVIQENQELFSETHPDFMFTKIHTSNGESKIKYELKDLARSGLLFDLDIFIIGEIKGDEAKGFSMAAYTGHQCITTGHGEDCIQGIYKLADYIQHATGYTIEECLKMLTGIKTIVYLKKYKIEEIAEVRGWNSEKKDLDIVKIFEHGMRLPL